MLGSFLSAWVLFPLVLLAASVGCGLLVRRIAGGELSAVLVTPVGFALVVVICAFATSYGWLAPAAGPIVAVAALTGFALEARADTLSLPRGLSGSWLWPLVAALVAFAAIGGPVFLTGSVGWTGYTRLIDIAFQMDFAQHLADSGRVIPPTGNSSYNIVGAKLVNIGYPGGSQATLGAMARLVRTDVAWCYQAFLAFTAAMGALAIFSILGRLTRNTLMRCLGAIVAIQPNVLYGYALEGGIKELTTVTLLMVAVALLTQRLPGDGRRRAVVPLAVAVSAAFGTFSLGIAPWLGVLLAGAFIASLLPRLRRRPALVSWAVFAGVAAAISLPGVITAAKLASVAGTAVGGVVDLGLGNLAAPVSRWSSAGVWMTADYRYPLAHATTSHIFDVIIIGLAALGVTLALFRRLWSIVVLGVTAPAALYYFIEHSTAWIQFKAFTVTAALSVTLAFAGAAALQGSRRRLVSGLGWLGGFAVAAAVLYGNALIYHDTPLAPGARYHDLAAISTRYADQGPALDPYFDEYAEYFLRNENGSALVDPANLTLQVRPGVPPPPGGQSFAWDLNQLEPAYVQGFPLIIQPRNPVASRAPANYDLVERTRYFDVWRRDRPAETVLIHYPFSSQLHERTPKFCRILAAEAQHAGAGGQIAFATTSTVAVANFTQGPHSDYWKPLGPATLAAYGAGAAQTDVTLPKRGRYTIWLQGSVGRPLAVYLDGKRWSSIGYEERYPSQFLLLGAGTLTGGTHTLRLVRGGGSLHPGSGDAPVETVARTIGAIVVNQEESTNDHVYVAPASSTSRICNAPVGYQWLELLTRGGASANALPAKL